MADPRDTAYMALYLSIIWYKFIDPDAALRIARGRSSAKPGKKVTPEILEQIMKIAESCNFKNFNSIEKRFKINRYDIITSEEAFSLSQIDMLIKRLKVQSESCNGECEKCILNADIRNDGYTLCEFLSDTDIEKSGKPINKQVQKSAKKCTVELLTGDTAKKGFEIYKSVLDEFGKYINSRKDKKIKDIASAALVEYMERHK